MNTAFAVDEILVAGDSCRRFEDLNLPSEESLKDKLRNICGLFIRIVGAKIFLVHLTARDFLVKKIVSTDQESVTHAYWMHSFELVVSNSILAQICMTYLMLEELNRDLDFVKKAGEERIRARLGDRVYEEMKDKTAKDKVGIVDDNTNASTLPDPDDLIRCESDSFINYAAQNWAQHFEQGQLRYVDAQMQTALSLFSVRTPRFRRWFSSWTKSKIDAPSKMTRLIAASKVGLSSIVDTLIKHIDEKELNYRDQSGRTALHHACIHAHTDVVRSLLSCDRIDIDTGNKDGGTLLNIANRVGNVEKVKLLIQFDGLYPNTRDNTNLTPLHLEICTEGSNSTEGFDIFEQLGYPQIVRHISMLYSHICLEH